MDWEGIKRIGFGPLSLSPKELGELTWGEFLDLLNGWKWRQRQKRRDFALLAAWVTAPHLKKPLNPNDLVGDEEDERENKKTTPEKTSELLNDMMREAGIKGQMMGG